MEWIRNYILDNLEDKKNLLAFSFGVDSSALFHILRKYNIKFDIAFVNYGIREEAVEEEAAARALAKKSNINIYVAYAPKWDNSFEKRAREFRYSFFESIIEEYDYHNLLTAHQLNDSLEWLLMRLSKGAGVVELMGLEETEERKTKNLEKSYKLIRPLLQHSKNSLEEFLKSNKYKYFQDKSNFDENYERNFFRHNFSNPLIDKYADGIRKSLEYLKEDKKEILSYIEPILSIKYLRVLKIKNKRLISRAVDRELKQLGYLMSGKDREIISENCSLVIGRKWCVEEKNGYIFIAPYIKNISIPKKIKELYRLKGLPPKIRPYLYSESIKIELLPSL